MVPLETPRLTLRPFHEADLDRLAELTSNPGFMRFSSGEYSRAQTADFLQRRALARIAAGQPAQLAVIHRDDDRLIGYCGFFVQSVDGKDELEIGYRLDPEYWNRGLATEAASAVRDYAFDQLGRDYVISLIHPENAPSRRVVEKIGMTYERATVFHGFHLGVYSLRRPIEASRVGSGNL